MSRGAGIAIGLATALVIVAVSIVPFLTAPWMSFAQARAEVGAWTGWSEPDIRTATNGIVSDLVTGGDFDATVGGEPVLTERERSHMRDVRNVFFGFYAVALLALAGIVLAFMRAGPAAWVAVRGGAVGLMAALFAIGVLVVRAFDALFSLFHGLFFASGSWTFDPATDRIVQLFPDQFWFETTAAVGGLSFAIALGAWWFAGRLRAA